MTTIARRCFLKLLGLGAVAAVTPDIVFSGQEPPSPESLAEYERIKKELAEGPYVNPHNLTKEHIGLPDGFTVLPNGDIWLEV